MSTKGLADSAPDPTAHAFKAVVLHSEDFPDLESDSRVRVIWLAPDDPDLALPDYQAGQYAMLTFPGCAARPFSIANAPNGKFLEFHIRRTTSGASHYATEILKPDDVLDIAAPYGSCVYMSACSRPLIAVAGGTGLAPMKAIVEASIKDAHAHDVFLYHGVRGLDDLYLEDFFLDLEDTDKRFHYVPVLSEEKIEGIRHGLVAAEMVKDFPDLKGARIFGAGPVELVRHMTELCLAAGADPSHIHSDLGYCNLCTASGPERDE